MIAAATPTLAGFLAVVFEPNDLVEIRALRHDGRPNPPQRWELAPSLANRSIEIGRMNTAASVYFGVNPRDARGGEARHVSTCRSLVADFDGGIGWPEARQRIEDAGLPDPSAVVASGGGVHAYWRLAEPIDPASWSGLQRGLAAMLDSDTKITDPPRVMRLPGTVNRKPARNGARCEILQLAGDHYELAEFADCAAIGLQPPDASPVPPATPGERRELPGWIASAMVNGVAEGERNDKAFEIAAHLAGNGWPQADAERQLERFAEACRPPMDRAEALAVVCSAYSAPREPVRNVDPGPVDISGVLSKAGKVNKARRLMMTKATNIDDDPTAYLWPRRFARGAMNIIFSRPGAGKSTIAADLAARVSNGAGWPDGLPCESGSVIYVRGEGTDRAIADRLSLAGADMNRLHLVGRAEVDDDSSPMLDMAGVDAVLLREAIEGIGDVRLVILDTLDSLYPNMRMIDNGHIRKSLWPMQELAEQLDLCVVVLAHTNKGGYADPLDRLSGGRAIGGAARSVWYLGQTDRESDLHYLAVCKANDFRPAATIEYRIVGQSPDLPGSISWGTTAEHVSAWDLDQPTKKEAGSSKAEACTAWMSERLAAGPVEVKEFSRDARGEGYGNKVLKYARDELGVKAVCGKGKVPPDRWYCLPDQEPPPPVEIQLSIDP